MGWFSHLFNDLVNPIAGINDISKAVSGTPLIRGAVGNFLSENPVSQAKDLVKLNSQFAGRIGGGAYDATLGQLGGFGGKVFGQSGFLAPLARDASAFSAGLASNPFDPVSGGLLSTYYANRQQGLTPRQAIGRIGGESALVGSIALAPFTAGQSLYLTAAEMAALNAAGQGFNAYGQGKPIGAALGRGALTGAVAGGLGGGVNQLVGGGTLGGIAGGAASGAARAGLSGGNVGAGALTGAVAGGVGANYGAVPATLAGAGTNFLLNDLPNQGRRAPMSPMYGGLPQLPQVPQLPEQYQAWNAAGMPPELQQLIQLFNAQPNFSSYVGGGATMNSNQYMGGPYG